MKLPSPGRYVFGSFILLLTAGICAGVVSITGRQDIISAALLVSAVILFLTAILLLVFHRPDSLDQRFVSLLQVQGTINTCTVAADLGLSGLSCFLPQSRSESQGVMHLIPVSRYSGEPVAGSVFVSGEGFSGLLPKKKGRPGQMPKKKEIKPPNLTREQELEADFSLSKQ